MTTEAEHTQLVVAFVATIPYGHDGSGEVSAARVVLYSRRASDGVVHRKTLADQRYLNKAGLNALDGSPYIHAVVRYAAGDLPCVFGLREQLCADYGPIFMPTHAVREAVKVAPFQDPSGRLWDTDDIVHAGIHHMVAQGDLWTLASFLSHHAHVLDQFMFCATFGEGAIIGINALGTTDGSGVPNELFSPYVFHPEIPLSEDRGGQFKYLLRPKDWWGRLNELARARRQMFVPKTETDS